MSKRASYDSPDYVARVHTDEGTLATLGTETSRRFHDLMDAAMLVSFYKYGHVGDGYPERVNAIESLRLRLDKYAATGNAEYLVDASGAPGRVLQGDGQGWFSRPRRGERRDLRRAEPVRQP